MKQNLIDKIIQFLKKDNFLHHKKLMVYLVFIFISAVIWFLITLGNNFVTDISYPVRFSKLPEDKVLVNELPEYLNFKVEAYGFTLLRYNISRSLIPININLKKNSIFKVPGSKSEYFLLTRYAQSNIISQISDELKILDIRPDSIIFDFSPIVSKKVPIIPEAEFSLGKQFLLKSNIYTIPDSITITGPGSILDTINMVGTKKHDFDELISSLNRNVSLVPIENVEFSENRVNIIIDVEKYTQGTFIIPISVINVPDSLSITTLPDMVNVTFQAALSDFSIIEASNFRAVANYKNIVDAHNQKLKVELKRYPSSIRAVNINPVHVDFFLEKKTRN